MSEPTMVDLDRVDPPAIKESLHAGLPQCLAMSPGFFGCTRSKGHSGPHVASGMTDPFEAWEAIP